MIEAKHNKLALAIFNPYINYLIKKNFGGIYLVNQPEGIIDDKGIIILPNHFSWWDGFFIHVVQEKIFNRNIFIMMLEEQLKRYWFFQYVGSFSVNPHSPKSVLESLNYSASIADSKENSLVIYPQGEIEPFEKEELSFKNGMFSILNQSQGNVSIIPVAFKISYTNEKKPDVYCRFGASVNKEEAIKNNDIIKRAFFENIKLLRTDLHPKKETVILGK